MNTNYEHPEDIAQVDRSSVQLKTTEIFNQAFYNFHFLSPPCRYLIDLHELM